MGLTFERQDIARWKESEIHKRISTDHIKLLLLWAINHEPRMPLAHSYSTPRSTCMDVSKSISKKQQVIKIAGAPWSTYERLFLFLF